MFVFPCFQLPGKQFFFRSSLPILSTFAPSRLNVSRETIQNSPETLLPFFRGRYFPPRRFGLFRSAGSPTGLSRFPCVLYGRYGRFSSSFTGGSLSCFNLLSGDTCKSNSPTRWSPTGKSIDWKNLSSTRPAGFRLFLLHKPLFSESSTPGAPFPGANSLDIRPANLLKFRVAGQKDHRVGEHHVALPVEDDRRPRGVELSQTLHPRGVSTPVIFPCSYSFHIHPIHSNKRRPYRGTRNSGKHHRVNCEWRC